MSTRRSFEWDDSKAQSNLAKHGVSFDYAIRVFLDPWLIDFEVSKPEDREVRQKAVGVIKGELVTVVYTPRAGVTRIISARRSNVTEARRYGPLHA
ncbi:MAG: BrnT family toxin [Phenylobacterium sp.]|uniref:BrnT family toxin n=1 Tax=Phenylobacterium sp. TaxID=1871053 RepID=UPI001B6B32AE|nr:BrnT family toxin [Phenylobacterium sp.]MBP7649140.1 BrnT family toxin [Phenylobacterium sp.]MBP7816816.1 BrnT family toxin [Phenylobacterium sp.]